MMRSILAVVLCVVGSMACASGPGDALEIADTSAADLTQRAPVCLSALEHVGWLADGSVFDEGDILALRLYEDGTYVRLRCHGAGCAKAVPETDRFTAFRWHDRQYIEFASFVRVLAPPRPVAQADGGPPKAASGPEYEDRPVVADTYELRTTRAQIELRRTHTSRWTTLHAVGDPTLCEASGGTWSPAPPPGAQICKVPPTTKGEQPALTPPAGAACVPSQPARPDPSASCRCPPGEYFASGAAGCIDVPRTTEDACDMTNGSYTDDDATRLGTFCQCGLGRTLTESGCVDL